jgi:hypothetical protein
MGSLIEQLTKRLISKGVKPADAASLAADQADRIAQQERDFVKARLARERADEFTAVAPRVTTTKSGRKVTTYYDDKPPGVKDEDVTYTTGIGKGEIERAEAEAAAPRTQVEPTSVNQDVSELRDLLTRIRTDKIAKGIIERVPGIRNKLPEGVEGPPGGPQQYYDDLMQQQGLPLTELRANNPEQDVINALAAAKGTQRKEIAARVKAGDQELELTPGSVEEALYEILMRDIPKREVANPTINPWKPKQAESTDSVVERFLRGIHNVTGGD